MNRFFKPFVLFIILFSCIQASAQVELKSKVVDFITYQPVESASIYVENTTIGTISNSDGNFVLNVPEAKVNDTLVISSIGYKSFRSAVKDFDASMDVFLEEDMASLDEVILIAETRPKTGNDIVLKAIKELPDNLPEQPYLQKGFLRHKERNIKEYKWLIESALTLYDSSYASGAADNLKINVDENRKSYDLREVDSLFVYYSYLRSTQNFEMKSKQLNRDTIKTSSLAKAIKWNDERVNGLGNLFKSRLNLVRNSNMSKALFGENILGKHQFRLDTILVDNGRKLYKIEITKGADYVGLNSTNRIYNEGFEPHGWLYIYWDTYAIKKIEYDLVAASDKQKRRSKSLLGTLNNHKLVITYTEYQGKMYPNYFYYEAPKLVNVGDRSSDRNTKTEAERRKEKEEQFYYTVQEILFTEIIQDPEEIAEALQKPWADDIFVQRPYNKEFWKNYNVLLESEEEEKLIQDLSKRATLYKE